MSRTVRGQHIRAGQLGKASELALGSSDAACSAAEKLSFACQCCAAFSIDAIKDDYKVHLVLFRTCC